VQEDGILNQIFKGSNNTSLKQSNPARAEQHVVHVKELIFLVKLTVDFFH
jgi:hypothetical protein